MEAGSHIFVDPDEDEIFFYKVTEKETQLTENLEGKVMPRNENILENCLKQNNGNLTVNGAISSKDDAAATLDATVTLEDDLELKSSIENENVSELNQMNEDEPHPKSQSVNQYKSFNGAVELNSEVLELEKRKSEAFILNLPNDQILQEKNNGNNKSLTKIDIYADHNYSTPVKSIIDKSILITPKSVVKADRDGGFLKVLSEIALVKAEADENLLKSNLKKDSNSLCTDLERDKKNNFENEVISIESSQIKNDISSSKSLLMSDDTNGEHKSKSNSYQNGNDLSDLEIIFEKLKSNFTTCENNLLDRRKCDIESHNDEVEVMNCFKLLDKTKSPPKSFNHYSTVCKDAKEVSKGFGKTESERKKNESCNTMRNSCNDDYAIRNKTETIPGKIAQRKPIKRHTMRLLEELNELVNSEHSKRDSSEITSNAFLCEEARKVVAQLKEVVLDDSLSSIDEYFDMDKENDSFLSPEMIHTLNTTLSKPFDELTNNDFAFLLEKLNYTFSDDNIKLKTIPLDLFETEKENLYNKNSAFDLFETQKHQFSGKSNEDENTNFFKSEATPVTKKILVNSVVKQAKTNEKLKINVGSQSERKPKTRLCQQGQVRPLKGCQSTEKNLVGSTKIPKLRGTSKIPVNENLVNSKNPPSGTTPGRNTARSLKFNNIESPVQAYINSKTSVLISNVKTKSEPAFNVWMKHLETGSRFDKANIESKTQEAGPKSNLPYVEYKSAIPLKLEKPTESRLPRLAPKMKKLIGNNSPVIAKHEGRIQLSAPRRPQTQTSRNGTELVLSSTSHRSSIL